jgi:pimeloyl-ACP methyl ester carboxylesterase
VQPQFPQQEPEETFVDLSGARVYTLRAGTGRPLFLVHGLVGSSTNWRRNIAALAPHASVYAIDQLNMGRSQRVAGLDASLEATADRIVGCMDALGIAKADIAGHSHGGAVSLMLAAQHPERVRSLILFAPANPYSRFSDPLVRLYNSFLGRRLAYLVPNLPSSLHRFALGRMYGDPARIPEGCLEGYTEGLRVPGTVPHILNIVRNWHAEMARLKEALPRVASIPTLLLWGNRDRAVDPASAHTLHQILSRSELRIVPDAGHVLFEEFPAEANPLMLDWLSRDLASLSFDSIALSHTASRPYTLERPASVAALIPRNS